MLFTLLASLAFAAPWSLDVTASLPDVPNQILAYDVVEGQPLTDLAMMQDVFGVQGVPTEDDLAGGVVHVGASGYHMLVFANGGAAYHDTIDGASEAPIRPAPEAMLWDTADLLLTDLGLFQDGPVTLLPDHVGGHTVSLHAPGGRVLRSWTAHQTLTYVQQLDGMPTFGGGSEVQIIFGADAEIVGFTHNVRNLTEGELLTVDAPELAIERFLARAETEDRWNMLKAAIFNVERVEISNIELGYYMPDNSQISPTIEPVYELTGTAYGQDHLGKPTRVDVLWYEPVTAGREIPSLVLNQ